MDSAADDGTGDLQQDEIDLRKENLIEEIEARMKQKIETNELFTIKWKAV